MCTTTPADTTNAVVWTRDSVDDTWDGPVQLVFPTTGSINYIRVAISGDGQTIILGDPLINGDAGTFWVFKKSVAGTWDMAGQYDPPAGFSGMLRLGNSVSTNYDGTVLAVGAERYDNFDGATFIYRLKGSSYEYEQFLGNPISVGIFGYNVALDSTGVSSDAKEGNTLSLVADSAVSTQSNPSCPPFQCLFPVNP